MPPPQQKMPQRLLGPLGWRLALAFVGVAVGAVLTLAILALVQTRSQVGDLSEQRQEDAARTVVDAVNDAYRNGAWDERVLDAAVRLAVAADIHMEVHDAAGATIAATGGVPMMPRGVPSGGGGGGVPPGFGVGPPGGPDPPRLVPVVAAGRTVGMIVLRYPPAGLSSGERHLRDALGRMLLLGGILASLLAVAVAFVVTRRITRPIVALTAAVRRIAAGDRDVRAAPAAHAPGELGELATAFDRMADGLERQETLRRALVADVAHELRTPLTIVQGYCEEMVDGIARPTPERIGMIRDETLRIGRLVGDLEMLAAADAAGVRLELRAVALDIVVSEAVDLIEPNATAKGLCIVRDVTPVEVAGDRTRLRQVLTNLLMNSMKFTAEGGEIHVRLGIDPDDALFARLDVGDTGAGISPDDVLHVFERFWRGRAAASVSGSGIGLAVVAEIVAAHQGTVDVTSVLGHGTTVRVRLPRPGAEKQ